MNRLLRVLFLSAVFVFSSCEEKLDRSVTFTQEWLFTKGIEGPSVDSKGDLYAVNYQNEGTVGVVDAEARVSLFVNLPKGSIANGIRFDAEDNMYLADYTKHRILIIKKGSREIGIFAQDSTMNQPNDLAITANGILYASDPDWKNNTGNIWKIIKDSCILLEQGMGTTNGIAVSPESDKLYVNESVQRKIWVYDIKSDGFLKNKKLFASFPDYGLDGMRCDARGNLYVCRYGKGTVEVISPNGHKIREIQLTGKKPTNIAFGGIDKKHCFITIADRGCFEVFMADHPGVVF